MKLTSQLVFTFSFLALHFCVYGQSCIDKPDWEPDHRILSLDLFVNKEAALRDIAMHKMKIFGQGGISPTAYCKSDSIFEIRFKVSYQLFGCTAPYNWDDMEEYNLEIGKYLDKKYGTYWRKELHTDVIALKN